MPDANWETVSASQSAALFGVSPYATRWQLWHAFRTRDRALIEAPEQGRMTWGKMLEHVILKAAAENFRLELQQNFPQTYERKGRLGCTIDGHLIAPDVGEIVVEAKNVDWLRWRDTWTETAAPPHIEIQLQQQLLVRGMPRGVIACFVGGNEMRFYERKANPEIWRQLETEAAQFFVSLETGEEPDPLGSALELPALAQLYPAVEPGKELDAMDDADLAETISMFAWAREQEGFHGRVKAQAQAKLLARAQDAAIVKAPGIRAFITKTAIGEAHIVRKPSIRTLIKVQRVAGEEPAAKEAIFA